MRIIARLIFLPALLLALYVPAAAQSSTPTTVPYSTELVSIELPPDWEQDTTTLDYHLFFQQPRDAVNLVVSISSLEGAPPLEELGPAVADYYDTLEGMILISHTPLVLPAGPAYRIDLVNTRTTSSGLVTAVQQIQYILLQGDDLYTLTFTFQQDRLPTYLLVMEQIMASFRFAGDGTAAWTEHRAGPLVLRAPEEWLRAEGTAEHEIVLALPDELALASASYSELAAPVELEAIEASLLSSITERGIALITLERIALPAGEGLIVYAAEPLAQPNGTAVQGLLYEYVILVEGGLIVANFRAEAAAFTDYAPLFRQMAATLALSEEEAEAE